MCYTADMFSFRPSDSRKERDLRRWLLSKDEEERIAFIKEVWEINYPFALTLLQSMQLSRTDTERLLRHFLRTGAHNAAAELIIKMEPMLGTRKFWRVVCEEPLSQAMRDFINYQSNGKLDAMLLKASAAE